VKLFDSLSGHPITKNLYEIGNIDPNPQIDEKDVSGNIVSGMLYKNIDSEKKKFKLSFNAYPCACSWRYDPTTDGLPVGTGPFYLKYTILSALSGTAIQDSYTWTWKWSDSSLKWYSYPYNDIYRYIELNEGDSINIELGSDYCSMVFDEIALIRVDVDAWQITSGQITYFKVPDTDLDGKADDQEEFKVNNQEESVVNWIEVESFQDSESAHVINDEIAGNGVATSSNMNDNSIWDTSLFSLILQKQMHYGTWDLYVKARIASDENKGVMKIVVQTTDGIYIKKTIIVTSREYMWYEIATNVDYQSPATYLNIDGTDISWNMIDSKQQSFGRVNVDSILLIDINQIDWSKTPITNPFDYDTDGNGLNDKIDPRPVAKLIGYYRYEDVIQLLNDISNNYNNIAKLYKLNKYFDETMNTNIGTTSEGRDIYGLKISNAPQVENYNKPVALFIGVHHAREPVTMKIVVDLIVRILTSYYSDDKIKSPDGSWSQNNIKDLLNKVDIWLIPCLNPDGYIYDGNGNFDGDGHHPLLPDLLKAGQNWRKNRRDNGIDFQKGVDLNRNYDIEFFSGNNNPNSLNYRGPFAFSEPETQVIRTFSNLYRIKTAISYHSHDTGGKSPDAILRPEQESNHAQVINQKDIAIFESLSKDLSDFTGYSWMRTYPEGWVSGVYNDWSYADGSLEAVNNIYYEKESAKRRYVFEIEAGLFYQSINTIDSTAQKNLDGALWMVYQADNLKNTEINNYDPDLLKP
jgi:hypothetical protein